METLRARLSYEPRELQFGTSGRRGLVADLTPLEIYINVLAELEYLQSSGVMRGDEFFFAQDLRPSSNTLSHAAVHAIHDAGMRPGYLGCIPTRAVAACGGGGGGAR